MKIIETYGNYIEKWSNENPGRARWLLKTGWKAQNLKFRFAPDKRLMPAEQELSRLVMDTMIRPLERPEESAIVSIFTPCEILQEAGLHPYNVEGFSCYLSASKAERAFLQQAENTGISETLCSYHKTFIGAAQKKVLPKPKCIVYTNLTCDANLLTFKKLAKMYDVPIFAIDVPMQQNEDNVQYVADQLRKLKDFIEECTGKKITDETLTERLRRSKRTLEKFAFGTWLLAMSVRAWCRLRTRIVKKPCNARCIGTAPGGRPCAIIPITSPSAGHISPKWRCRTSTRWNGRTLTPCPTAG